MDLIVKKSKIHGKGVFANRDFKKGEIIVKWEYRELTECQAQRISKNDLPYLNKISGKYLLMDAPGKYVNSSCNPNTFPIEMCDVALRDIKKGEEITTDYGNSNPEEFICNCQKCREKKALNYF